MRSGFWFSIIVSIILCAPVLAYDWSTNPGSGSPENPYQISTPEHLMSIGSDSVLLTKHYVLTSDIVFDPENNPAHVFEDALIAGDYFIGPYFTGHFDGNGYRIENLKIVGSANYPGLFGCLAGTGPDDVLIEDLTLINPQLEGGRFVGSLAGYLLTGKVESCSIVGGVVGHINESGGVGGMFGGIQYATVAHCSSSAEVVGVASIGGLIGFMNAGTVGDPILYSKIIDSHASGIVTTSGNGCGGLVGVLNLGLIENCSASGNVSGNSNAGGLVGRINTFRDNWATGEVKICRSYASGNVQGTDTCGGLVGFIDEIRIIEDCYALGNIVGTSHTGGLVGSNFGTVIRSYSKGMVSGTGGSTGGLIGVTEGDGSTLLCYWDTESSQILVSNGGNGKTTPEMQTQSTFVGWDFVGESTNGDNEIWRMCADGVDYPRLSWEFAQNGDFACGDGTDILDLLTLAEHWLLVGTAHPTEFNTACDANGDETIDFLDYAVLGENW